MSQSGLPMLELQYEDEDIKQHLIQPEASYWLTSESPISRSFSTGAPLEHRTSTGYIPAAESFSYDSRQSFDNFNPPAAEILPQNVQFDNSLPHLHISELETRYAEVPSGLPWVQPSDHMMFARPYSTNTFQPIPAYMSNDYPDSVQLQDPCSPYSTPSLFDNSPMQSPYLSSPELYSARYSGRAPRSSPNDDYDIEDDNEEEDVSDGKPYARLIYEALVQAPAHRMRLRDIYEWFEQNTNKPRESGSNGWQNSIRHNLSMNKAFENDKTQSVNARGQPKKATSVWFLTQDALVHGVQSTTRYRKTGGVRKTGLSGSPDYRRQRSGAKGGRAARRAARLRRMEQSHTNWGPITSDEVDSFNHLVHAANYLNEYSPHYDSAPPTPSESFPYTPRSPTHRLECPVDGSGAVKLESFGLNSHELRGQDMLFQHPFETPMEDPW